MSRCLTQYAVAALVVLALGAPLAQASHTPLSAPAFTLRVDGLSTNVQPGENATYNVTIGNAGVLERDAGLSISSALPPGWTYELAPLVKVPGQSNVSTLLTVFVPAQEQPKTVAFVVDAADATWGHNTNAFGNVTVRARETAGDATPLPPPDLAISVSTGDSGESGSLVQGELVIRNVDALQRTVSVQVSLIPRDDWSAYVRPSDANRVIAGGGFTVIPLFVQLPELTQNETKRFDISIVPSDGPAQTAQWEVVGIAPPREETPTAEPTPATSGGTPGASGSVGAQLPPRTFGPGLDVFIEPVELDVTSGAEATATVRLVNTGTSALIVDLVSTPPPSWPAFVFEPAQAISLAPGEDVRVDMRIAAPAGIPPGGSTTGSVSALASDGLTRRASVLMHVVSAVPSDASSAATIEAPVAPSDGSVLEGPATLVIVGLAAVGGAAAIVASRPLREKLLWGAAGLYTRLARPDVLGHEDREKLYRLVETQPGIHFHALQRDLAWNTGTLTYHLRVLERHGFLVSRRDGLYRRFYLSGAAPRKEVFENQGPTGLRADVLEAVRTQPGISQSDLALGLGANKQTVNYHVKALERAGTIRVEKRGRDTYLYPGDGNAVAPPAAPAERERAKL